MCLLHIHANTRALGRTLALTLADSECNIQAAQQLLVRALQLLLRDVLKIQLHVALKVLGHTSHRVDAAALLKLLHLDCCRVTLRLSSQYISFLS